MKKIIQPLRYVGFIFTFISASYCAQSVSQKVTTLKKTMLPANIKFPAEPYSVMNRLQNKGNQTNDVNNRSSIITDARSKKSSLSTTSSSKLPISLGPSSNVPVEAIQPKSNLD